MAILRAAEISVEKGWTKVWIETDSMAAYLAFKNENLLWWLKARWTRARSKLTWWKVTHIHREANFSADTMAKKAAGLQRDQEFWSDAQPEFLPHLEDESKTYFRIIH
ncbi:hypothetical protein ACHQM5_019025 [Ranunculus cassubicifolius]